MAINISTNMLLPIPQVGSEAGPDYATDVNNCLTLIDQHNHTPGYGVQITPDGLNLNSDVDLLGNNLTIVRSLRLQSQGSVLVGSSDLGCVYEVLQDLYFNDGNGNNVRITQNGAVAGTPGSIANLTAPASAAYVSASSTFVFQSDSNTPANIDGASFLLRNLLASSNALTLQPPAAMASNYTITLPNVPASTLPVTMTSGGVMGTGLIQNSQTQGSALVPTGSSANFWGTSAPTGWLLCDGSAVSRTTYAALYAVIGDACGNGDGSTTFNVPDTRGLFIRYVDGLAGRDPDASSRTASASGGNTGNNVGSYEADAFASHTHSLNSGTSAGVAQPAAQRDNAGAIGYYITNATGGNETRPKNIYCNQIIKT